MALQISFFPKLVTLLFLPVCVTNRNRISVFRNTSCGWCLVLQKKVIVNLSFSEVMTSFTNEASINKSPSAIFLEWNIRRKGRDLDSS